MPSVVIPFEVGMSGPACWLMVPQCLIAQMFPMQCCFTKMVCAPAATHRDSCELVHIDFSVCFDKGASLAVPEVVPFRLTQMMQVRGPSTGRLGAFAHLWRHH
jgi:hypothetical protein